MKEKWTNDLQKKMAKNEFDLQDYLEQLCKNGAERASRIAYKTLNKVYKKLGFLI